MNLNSNQSPREDNANGISTLHSWQNRFQSRKGQSFLELALVLPVLIIILLGLVEVVFFIGRYLDMLDMTREAARFASVRDPFDTSMVRDLNCSTPNEFYFYYDTACLFSPPNTAEICTAACTGNPQADPLQCSFCNGLNPYFALNRTTDDVIITVYTVDQANNISDTHPKPDTAPYGGRLLPDSQTQYWALSNSDNNPDNDDLWKKDCQGNIVRDLPDYTKTSMQQMIHKPTVGPDGAVSSQGSAGNKGFVVVEAYYCYEQALNLARFLPNPMRIHAYTIMPLPAAQPTPTPRPAPISP